ncbi:hypothetical protein NOM01_04435 [Sporolactobacillus sp. STSJ-5]|uniref:hypothetical protein n=1 Tax=Sporolactobacillus sp. STSJ-5 TaxID=2965076 RepID=UPI0021065E97|nr:hypothetical protein [Sporolactobacillus sp. STSJ-5]MCQ2009241.1 hypothetical protein [Sporolactobacillus sp. STSJ-5]
MNGAVDSNSEERDGRMAHYELEFCFPNQPKIILKAFVSAGNEKEAKDRFEKDYPNLIGCKILKTKLDS